MIFENKQEAFNYWNTKSKTDCEKRANELKAVVDTDPNADIINIQIELEGLKEALANMKEKEEVTEVEEDIRSFRALGNAEFRSTNLNTEPVQSLEYRKAFFKNLRGEKLNTYEQRVFNEVRADNFNDSTNTGNVIPEQTLNEIIRLATDKGGLISVVRQFNIPSNIAIPVSTPNSKANWHIEGEEIEPDKVSINKVTFDGYELIKIFSLSEKLKDMSISAFESYLTEELSNCMMQTLADSIVNGTGENQGTGILNGITWNETNTVKAQKELTYQDIVKAVAGLHSGYHNNAMFVMNNSTFFKSVIGMVDTTGNPIFVADPTERAKGTILGFPVVLDDFIPDNVILFGDPKYIGYNLPKGIVLDSSIHSGYRSGLIDFRAIAIADCKPIIDEAFIKIEIEDAQTLDMKDVKGVVTIGTDKK